MGRVNRYLLTYSKYTDIYALLITWRLYSIKINKYSLELYCLIILKIQINENHKNIFKFVKFSGPHLNKNANGPVNQTNERTSKKYIIVI